jgi:hypothetical protein
MFMPVFVTTRYLGKDEIAPELKSSIEGLFQQKDGEWHVAVIGARENDLWKVKVTNPEGSTASHVLDGADGKHTVYEVTRIVRELVATHI